MATVPLESWQPPEPHPNPHFATRVQIQRQRIVGGGVCSKCGKLIIQIGHNQRDVDETWEHPANVIQLQQQNPQAHKLPSVDA